MTDRDPEPTLMLPEEKEKEDQGDSLPWKAKTIKEKDLNLSYGKVFLPRSKESRRIFSCLEREVKYLPPETSKVFVFGKWHPIPRKQAGYGDEGVTYTYSRVTLAAQTWTPVLRELVSKVRRITGIGYNFVLINRYADGKDCMGEHKDDEKELDPEAPIASMSFGAERDFYFKHQRTRNNKDKSIPKVNLKLEDGSLLLMNEPTNKFWYHALPARKSCRDVRINLTFRKVEMKK